MNSPLSFSRLKLDPCFLRPSLPAWTFTWNPNGWVRSQSLIAPGPGSTARCELTTLFSRTEDGDEGRPVWPEALDPCLGPGPLNPLAPRGVERPVCLMTSHLWSQTTGVEQHECFTNRFPTTGALLALQSVRSLGREMSPCQEGLSKTGSQDLRHWTTRR